MNPNITAPGHSFKGAMAYLMHDRRQTEDAAHPATAERVAWAETRNLAGVGPHTATRVMIDHAQRADELKAAAGIKSTGRKSKAHVYAFSLSWRADEVDGLDREGMTRAADDALKFMKADHLQAVLIAHNDTAHPHVHIVLNRVQADGRMWNPSFDREKFSQWANGYERENGKIVTPQRDEKWRKIEAQQQEAKADPAAPRPATEDQKRRRRPETRQRAAERADRPREPSRGQILKDLSDAQKAQHKQDWKAWGAKAKESRKAIYDRADMARAAALEAFKQATRKDWAQHFKAERDRARAFENRERSFSGIIHNALAAAKQQFRDGPQGGRGLLGQTFANVLDSGKRREAFSQAQEITARQFREQMKARRDAALATLDHEKRQALIRQSALIDKAKADMIERHNQERDKMREAWRQFYASRESAAPGQTYRTRKPQPLRMKESQPMKDKFDAASMAAAKQTAARVPTDDHRLSTPAPAPRPAGIVDPPHSEIKPVPVVDRAAAIEAGRKPSARRDWTQPQEPPAPPQTGRTDWAARAKQLRAEHGSAAAPHQPAPRPSGPRMKP